MNSSWPGLSRPSRGGRHCSPKRDARHKAGHDKLFVVCTLPRNYYHLILRSPPLSPRYAQVFRNSNKLLHLSWDISRMQAFFLEEFCIVLLPAHPGAPSRGVLIGGAGAAPADGLASHLREPRGCCPALLRGPAIGGSSPPDECRRKPAGSGGRKVGPVVGGAVPAAKIAAVERREASVSRGRLRRLRKLVYGARRAPRLASVELLMRLSALRSLGHFSGDDSPGPPGDTKTGGPVA